MAESLQSVLAFAFAIAVCYPLMTSHRKDLHFARHLYAALHRGSPGMT